MRLFTQFIIIITSLILSNIVLAEGAIGANNQLTASKSILLIKTKTDLNKASAQELLLIKGLNTSKVRAIITYRKKNNGFKTLDELSQVKGMKRLKADEMRGIQEQLKV